MCFLCLKYNNKNIMCDEVYSKDTQQGVNGEQDKIDIRVIVLILTYPARSVSTTSHIITDNILRLINPYHAIPRDRC